MEKERKLKITNTVFKIIYITIYLTITAFIIYSLVDANIKDIDSESSLKSYPIAYLIVGIIFGAIGYGFILIIGLINMIITSFNKTFPRQTKTMIFSFLTTLLPIITFFLIILISKP